MACSAFFGAYLCFHLSSRVLVSIEKSPSGPFLTIAYLQNKVHSFLAMNEITPSKRLWPTPNEEVPVTAFEVLQYTIYVIQYMHAWIWLPTASSSAVSNVLRLLGSNSPSELLPAKVAKSGTL
ncbi:hypothetical protein COCC4DRAFT_62166 [Bipolaris maydis ATCC 48331]|uniref:Uncharacterized protein n=2 Tax=Cochliobolus heterostrophus TaxID=5016 RepID=M2UG07_COCH5|nr:uncharacterized protein COCC4DRAFT_62166 [Bipolaris maydis ATCC 48331]EMD86847.1 hypothetical protein COCHEDRAFT_1034090 [Bipolaris maydis C5]ENI04156.1 hypothetical protein COCC4DRAFT_62166 [Bipolaris maydis ATCC 48331]